MIGPQATARRARRAARQGARRTRASWIAQPVVQLSHRADVRRRQMGPRHVDLRPFAVNDGNRVWVLPGGLTRVALAEGELIVNSSRGGGSKDTWVLAGTGRSRRCADGARARSTASRRRRPQDVGPALDSFVRPARPSSNSNSRHAGEVAPMLSRIAESLFWIGRYVERAEDTARILDVQTQLILEDPASTRRRPAATCSRSWASSRLDARRAAHVDTARGAARARLRPRLPRLDRRHPGRRPRECPARPRDAVDLDVGGDQHDLPRDPLRPVPLDATARGLPVGARPRGADQRHRRRDDDPRRGLAVPDARPLDRARRHDLAAGRDRRRCTSGAAVGARSLRACGAYEAFLRTYRGLETERGAAEFLLLDRLFPRSVVFALNRAEQCLENLESAGSAPAFRTRRSGCSGGPAPSSSTARSATSSADLPQRDGTAAAHLRAGHRRDHPALLRRRRGHWTGTG